jgi:hypothetical protein
VCSAPDSLPTRLHRWAAALPATDPIPIVASEKYALASYAASMRLNATSEHLKAYLELIDCGTFRFRGHRIVVL